MSVTVLQRGTAWLDTGSFESLHDASEYVRVLERRQGTKVGCLEELAWRNGWIDAEQLLEIAEPLRKSGYGEYLANLLQERAIISDDHRALDAATRARRRRCTSTGT
ncbi:MAG: hypothetical protein V9G10_11355 [Candidatus Nanopelagicales bacterium]